MTDEAHVPAAPISIMQRKMLDALSEAQQGSAGQAASVCGLTVRFSREGHADVLWDVSPAPRDANQDPDTGA